MIRKKSELKGYMLYIFIKMNDFYELILLDLQSYNLSYYFVRLFYPRRDFIFLPLQESKDSLFSFCVFNLQPILFSRMLIHNTASTSAESVSLEKK